MQVMSLSRIKTLCFIALSGLCSFVSAEEGELRELLKQHVSALGGAYQLEHLSAIYLEGTQMQAGQSFEFVIRKKKPNSIRYALSGEAFEAVAGYDGQTGWLRLQKAEDVTISNLEGVDLQALIQEGRFDSRLFEAYQGELDSLVYVGVERIYDHKCDVIEYLESGLVRLRYYLDQDSFLLRKRELLDDDGAVTLATVYDNYDVVDGYKIAHRFDNLINGEIVSTQLVDKVIVNPGILSFYFEKPRR